MDARRFVASSCYYILMVSNGHKLIKRYTKYQFKISRRSIAFKVLYFIYIYFKIDQLTASFVCMMWRLDKRVYCTF